MTGLFGRVGLVGFQRQFSGVEFRLFRVVFVVGKHLGVLLDDVVHRLLRVPVRHADPLQKSDSRGASDFRSIEHIAEWLQ